VLVVGGAMAPAVSRRPVTVEAPARSHVSPCDICCEQSGTETGFSPSTSLLPCQYHSTNVLHTHLHLHVVLSRTNQRNLGNFQKQCYFGSQGVLEMKGTFTRSAVARRYWLGCFGGGGGYPPTESSLTYTLQVLYRCLLPLWYREANGEPKSVAVFFFAAWMILMSARWSLLKRKKQVCRPKI
jgi:hypothetical protein